MTLCQTVSILEPRLDLTPLQRALNAAPERASVSKVAARRELREEAGIEATELIDLGVVDQLTEVVVSPDHLFLARRLSFTKSDQEETEDIERIAVSLAQAVAWTLDGTISHAASVVLITKAAHLLKDERGEV